MSAESMIAFCFDLGFQQCDAASDLLPVHNDVKEANGGSNKEQHFNLIDHVANDDATAVSDLQLCMLNFLGILLAFYLPAPLTQQGGVQSNVLCSRLHQNFLL